MEENSPLVSICMPAFNAEKYIGEAIDSVLKQHYQHIELIIVNDGSTDKTSDVIKSFSDARIQLIETDNKGQCAAANLAFNYTKGSYIKFFDSDDILSPEMISSQVDLIAKHPGCIAGSSWGRFYLDDLSTFDIEQSFITPQPMKPLEWILKMMSNDQIMLQCGLWLIPKAILLKSGLWNENLSLINDFEFMIRVLLASSKLRFAPNAILYYRSGLTNSLSDLKSRKGAESSLHSLSLGFEYVLAAENSQRVRQIIANAFQQFIYDFYPKYSDLTSKAAQQVEKFGGSDLNFSAGGTTLTLSYILGWKITKRIKNLINK